MNLPKDFHFSQDIGPEIPLQGEKMKTSNPQDTFRISQKVSGIQLQGREGNGVLEASSSKLQPDLVTVLKIKTKSPLGDSTEKGQPEVQGIIL